MSAELLEQYQADNSLDMDSIAVEVQTDAVMVLSFLCEDHMHIKVMAPHFCKHFSVCLRTLQPHILSLMWLLVCLACFHTYART